MELSKNYDPKEFEDRLYKYWQDNDLFSPKPGRQKKTHTIVIPPPNVTGVLHMGHGLNNTIQDIITRYKRMQGYETLWIPGTDHAGIATQNAVEKELAKEGKKRDDFTREAFIDRVWVTALRHQNIIIEQLKKMGCSADWNRTAFTFDEIRSRGVKKVFVELYKKNLIYKSKYIVNWCPRCTTALADDEVEHSEKHGKLWYIKYPVKDSTEFVIVATTRPETMLGDTAVAFNDKDERYLHLKGKKIILPIVERELDIVFDSYVDPKFGTGAVKITPAHDPNDFEIGLRHNLQFINIFDNNAVTNSNVPEEYQKLDRYEARKKVVEDLERLGFLEKIENHKHNVGECYRCNTVIEPRYSDQWFVKMSELAKEAIKVVEDGKIEFTPKRWVKVYFNWLKNIKDWCISRQLWWGHRIPVYYCSSCGHQNVSESYVTVCEKCGHKEFTQDPDVLDTWFSSWLWPFTTLGWPDKTEDLKKFYPTSVLVTAPDIIFFWVARMIMAGLHFMDDIPFSKVFFTGTVMDLKGRKMSKSLGNGIDPFEVIERHGADSLRYTMIAIVSPNQNIKLGFPKDKNSSEPNSFEIGSRFANKIWNASRYILMNIPENFQETPIEKIEMDTFDKWIVAELNIAIKNINSSLEAMRFNDVANILQSFFWTRYCDWYIELSKTKIFSQNEKIKNDTLSILIYILRTFLKLLHPVMPFITEEIYQKLPNSGLSIMVEEYPVHNNKLIDKKVMTSANKLFDLIYLIRNIRGENNIPPEKKVKIYIKSTDKEINSFYNNYQKEILSLTKGEIITLLDANDSKPHNSLYKANESVEVYIDLEGLVDKVKEIERLTKELEKLDVDFQKTNNKLNNLDFINRAPEEIIKKEREKLAEFESKIEKIKNNLALLKG